MSAVRSYKSLILDDVVEVATSADFKNKIGSDAPPVNPGDRRKLWVVKPGVAWGASRMVKIISRDATGKPRRHPDTGQPFLEDFPVFADQAERPNVHSGAANTWPPLWNQIPMFPYPLRDLTEDEELWFAKDVPYGLGVMNAVFGGKNQILVVSKAAITQQESQQGVTTGDLSEVITRLDRIEKAIAALKPSP